MSRRVNKLERAEFWVALWTTIITIAVAVYILNQIN